MSYYSETALSTKDMPICEQVHDAVLLAHGGGRGADLLAFPECEEYLASSINRSTTWYDQYIQGLRGFFDNKKDFLRAEHLYKERYQCTFGSRTIYVASITFLLTCFYMVFFFPLLVVILGGGVFDFPLFFYKEFSEFLYLMAIAFALSKYLQYKLWNDTDASGYFFNRCNGMVEHRLFDETITIPFNELRPLAVQARDPGGHTKTGLMLFHDKMNLALPFPTLYLADAIISWCYLKQFMDISRPLPDIPEHEATRHLDPTTQRYDKETGRDPFYWRKKTEKEIMQLETEARKRVRAHYKEGVYFH